MEATINDCPTVNNIINCGECPHECKLRMAPKLTDKEKISLENFLKTQKEVSSEIISLKRKITESTMKHLISIVENLNIDVQTSSEIPPESLCPL